MTRYSLKFQHWPVVDRRMWQALISPGDILEGAGVCAHWSAKTQAVVVRDYGYWLSYLIQSGTDLAAAPPPDRVTPDRLRGYCQSMADVAAETRAVRVRRLVILVRNAKPAGTWQWLLQMRRSLEAASRFQGSTRRKGERIVPSSKLYDAGVRLLERTSAGARLTSFARASAIRDGLMIALLAARPLRLKNFAGLCVGVHLRLSSDGYLIDIPGGSARPGGRSKRSCQRSYARGWPSTLSGIARCCSRVAPSTMFGSTGRAGPSDSVVCLGASAG